MNSKFFGRWPIMALLWMLVSANAVQANEYPDIWLRDLPVIDSDKMTSRGLFIVDEKSDIDFSVGLKEVVLLLDHGAADKFGLDHTVTLVTFFSGRIIKGTVVGIERGTRQSLNSTYEWLYFVIKTVGGDYLMLRSQQLFPKSLKLSKKFLETGLYHDIIAKPIIDEKNSCETATKYISWNNFYKDHHWDKYVLVKTVNPIVREVECPHLGNSSPTLIELSTHIDSKPRQLIHLEDGTGLVELERHIVRLQMSDGSVPVTMADRVVTVDAERMHRFKTELRERMRQDGRLERRDVFQLINDEIENDVFGR